VFLQNIPGDHSLKITTMNAKQHILISWLLTSATNERDVKL